MTFLIDIDVEAARRQSFGAKFEHTARDEALAARVQAGFLDLSPHAAWALPETFDWSAQATQDRNWHAQLHMLRWLDPLRRRAERGDDGAADTWLRYAESWVRHNPSSAPAWAGSWGDMVDGIRALALCVAVPFVVRRDPEALQWLVPSIEEHLRWLSDESNLGHSNHALHQHQGLFVCGAVLRNEEAMALAEDRMSSLFETAYDEEGVNAEGAIAYHFANYIWWTAARRRLEVEGRPVPESLQLLDRVPIELAHATKPDGKLVGIGDTDGGNVKAVGHPATTWVTSRGADGAPPEDLIRIYDAGYLFARSGWGEQERDFAEETFWSVSFGHADRVHGHADGGSMTFSSMGHEWISDPGKFQYGHGDMRAFCLRRDSHSLPVVVDRDYDPKSVVACTARRIDDAVYDVTFVDRGYAGVRLIRRIVYSVSGEYAVVIDSVQSEETCTVVQHWQCGAGTDAALSDRGFELSAGEKRASVVYTGSRPEWDVVSGQERPLRGWVATGWKQRSPAPSLRFTKTGTAFRFITVIAAGFRGAKPQVETVRSAPKGQVRLRIDTGRVAEQLVIEPAAASVIGYSDNAEGAGPSRARASTSAVAPYAPDVRASVLEAIARNREAGSQASGRATRAALAERLRAVRANHGLDERIDLGIEAAVSDLQETLRHPATPREVQKDRAALVNWSGRADFRASTLRLPGIALCGADAVVPSLSEETLLAYTLGSIVLPAAVHPADGDTLTVLFHGAVDRARTSLPLFQRFRFQKELQAGPTVAFGDPTLDLARELRLGWYLGHERVDLAPAIARAVQEIARSLGTSKVVLQGSSGGGFAALQVGAHLPGSHVVAMNPQTDLRRYNVVAYRAAMIAAFGVRELDATSSLVPRIDVMRRVDELGAEMNVTLVMNSGDLFHEKAHAAPLRAFLRGRAATFLDEIRYDLGPGHRALANDEYGAVMGGVYDRIASRRPQRQA